MQFICLLAFANLIFGFVFAYRSRRITYGEFFLVSVVVWLLMSLVYGIYYKIRISDNKFINDRVISMRYEGPWVSHYTCCKRYATRCHGSGKHRTCTTYCAWWGTCYKSEGDYSEYTLEKHGTHQLSNEKLHELKDLYFSGPEIVKGSRPSYTSGDKNDYIWKIRPGKIAPWTGTVSYKNYVGPSENIIKGNSNVGEEVEKHPAKYFFDGFTFNKVIGVNLDQTKLAILNSSLESDANIIVYGFKDGTLSQCENLRAKWIGGKINDLVFCIIHDDITITRAKVFGWTESEIVKTKLQSELVNLKLKDFYNKANKFKEIIDKEYISNTMEKYNYLSVKIRGWDYVLFIFFFLAFAVIGWILMYINDIWDDRRF